MAILKSAKVNINNYHNSFDYKLLTINYKLIKARREKLFLNMSKESIGVGLNLVESTELAVTKMI